MRRAIKPAHLAVILRHDKTTSFAAYHIDSIKQ
jgi:hypothetical protein